MKAMVLTTSNPIERRPLALTDVPNPTPAPGEILVRVNVCGVCRTDLHEVEGELPTRRSPVIPGHQIVGTVEAVGETGGHEGVPAKRYQVGDRVGTAWLHSTCGRCEFCARQGEAGQIDADTAGSDRENLCNSADFTGWSVNGGYAEYATVPQAFAYRIPDGFEDEQAAPLLCAGIIGYRALRISAVGPRQRLGIYGFGASAHITLQVARHLGCEVFVFTRSEANRELARELGAAWVGGSQDQPPATLHGSIIFAPAGTLVLSALEVLEKGGTLALAGIYMTPVPPLDYVKHLYNERVLRSVANATRRDGRDLLDLAARIPIRTTTRVFPLDQANAALMALKTGGLTGSAVLRVG